MIMTMRQIIEKVMERNNVCPHCRGKDIAMGQDVVVNDDSTYDQMQCFDCGHRWLQGWELILCVLVPPE